ncbi:MAG: glycosyltransferase family 39 protein [Bacteroidales bacterium]|nr:glycosyltransferase family 39 protein [Bacteroidales bacterium]
MPDGRERAFRAWLVFVLAAGVVLRVAGLWAPLTHDELSAIGRLQFDSFADLIRGGVYPDGHPAGMQVMLWLWSRVVGTAAPLLRLPFTLLSAAAIPLIYSVGRRWYGRMAGLAAATVLAFSQYAVYYAMPVRPYGAGLFFVLLAVHFWTRICVEHRDGWGYVAGFALIAAACAYMHYFCALTVALLALAGLFVVGRGERRRYLGACFAAVLLFLPHLGITRHQLFDLQGVGGWLAAPEPVFLVHYLGYLCHHSLVVLAVMVVAWALLFDVSPLGGRWRLMLVALTLFVLPLAAGYVYSRSVNPVLQYSVLIFSWPFLLLAAVGFVGERCSWRHLAACAAIGVALLVSLFAGRRHYDVLRREYIASAVDMARDARRRYGADNVALYLKISPSMIAYYDTSLAVAADTGGAPEADYAVVANLFDDSTFAVMRRYPYVVDSRLCTTAPVFLLSRRAADGEMWPVSRLKEGRVAVDGQYTFLLDTLAADIAADRHFAIVAEAFGSDSSLQLVMESWVGRRCVDWRSVPLADSVCLPLGQDLCIKSRSDMRRSRIKIFILAPDAHSADSVAFRISTAPADPFRYAVIEEI